MNDPKRIRLAAAQPLSAKARRMIAGRNKPAGRRRGGAMIRMRATVVACWLGMVVSLAGARTVELGASGKDAVLVRDAAASGGETAAIRIGTSGESPGALWSLGGGPHGPGLFVASVTVRLQAPAEFDLNRLRLILTWLADGEPLAERLLNGATLDTRADGYTRIDTPLSLDTSSLLSLSCRWLIEPVAPGETARPAMAEVLPQAPSDASSLTSETPAAPDRVPDLDDLLAELAAEHAVDLDALNYPALLVDQAGIRLISDSLAVERVWPAKVHVYPGEPNPVTVTVRNYGAVSREALLRFTMRTGLDEVAAPVEARITVPAGGIAEHRFDWTAGAREFGHEARVQIVADGRTVHVGGEFFTVSAPLWKTAIQGSGFLTWRGRERQFPDHVAANRRGYINVEEAFSWQPSSWTDLNPTNEFWWSGQNNYHNSLEGLRLWRDLSRADGIKLITYIWATASGSSGAEWARRHPDLVTHHAVGLASEFHDVEDLRLYDITREQPEFWRHHYGVWHSFGINRGYLRLIETGADEIIRSADRFGWDGVRFDSQLSWSAMDAREAIEEIRIMDADEKMRRLIPDILAVTTGVWNANAVSIRNARYMKARLREGAGDRFEISSNYGQINTHAVADGNGPAFDYFREYCAGGSQVNQEYFRHARSWTNFYLGLLEQVEWTRRAGGFHAVQCIDDVGGIIGRAYNSIFLFAAGSHPYVYPESEMSPGRYARFMTRFGEYMWDAALEPVAPEDAGISVAAPRDWVWKPFLKRRSIEGGGTQTVVHLISPPVQDAIVPSRFIPAPPWPRGVRVTQRGGAIPAVWRLTAEPDASAELLTVERQGDAFTVTIPEHRFWTVLVWTEKEVRP